MVWYYLTVLLDGILDIVLAVVSVIAATVIAALVPIVTFVLGIVDTIQNRKSLGRPWHDAILYYYNKNYAEVIGGAHSMMTEMMRRYYGDEA